MIFIIVILVILLCISVFCLQRWRTWGKIHLEKYSGIYTDVSDSDTRRLLSTALMQLSNQITHFKEKHNEMHSDLDKIFEILKISKNANEQKHDTH